MCGTQTSAVCLSGCVELGQVLFVCLDVWDSSKSCVFALFIYCICSIHCMCGTRKSAVFFWMCGIQTSAVCLSGCVGLGQVLCVCLDVWDSDKCCVFVCMCGTQISAMFLSGCVGLKQVLCVCLNVWDSDK